MLVKYPNFFLVGTARAGTTSIYNYLLHHSDIFLPKIKEPCFFSFASEPKPDFSFSGKTGFITDQQDYLKLYNRASVFKIRGDFSTPYLYFYKNTIKNIKKYIPDYENVKIAIILRNPVERAYSQYMMNVRLLREPLSFQEAISEENNRMDNNYHFDYFYIDRSMYYKQVNLYLDAFNNVKIFFFEQLLEDPIIFMESLLEFLGLTKYHKIDFKKKYNISGKPRVKFFRKFYLNDSKIKSNVKKSLPTTVVKMIKYLDRINYKIIPLKDDTQKLLNNYFLEDIEKLEKLLSKKLSNWKA